MAEAQREGGVYNVGSTKEPRYADASGKETDAPSQKERAEADVGGTLDGVEFASDEARAAAEEAGFTAADFRDAKASGAGGFTKPDVRALIDAKG